MEIEVSAGVLTFPDDTVRPADSNARIVLEIIGSDGRARNFTGEYEGKGNYIIRLSGRDLSALPSGNCVLIVSGSFADPSSRQGDYPSIVRANFMLY